MNRKTFSMIVLAAGAVALGCATDDTGAVDSATDSAALANRCVTSPATITAGGVGPVRIGEPLTEVESRCEVRDTAFTLGEGMRESGRVVQLDGSSVVVLTNATGRVTRIIIEDGSLRTERGLGVGSTVGELRQAHGQLCAALGEGIVVVSSGNLGPISFATDADFGTVSRGASIDVDAIPDETSITSLWIYDGQALCGAS
jgi:hypothetical protein